MEGFYQLIGKSRKPDKNEDENFKIHAPYQSMRSHDGVGSPNNMLKVV